MYFPPFPRKVSLCVPMSPSLGRRLEGLALSKPSVTAGPKETSTYEGRDLGRPVWERWEATQREAARPFRGRDPHSVAPVPSQGQRVLWEESFPTSCANTGSVCCTQRMISQTVQCGSCLSCGVTEKSCHLTSVPLRASGSSACPLRRSSALCQTNCRAAGPPWRTYQKVPVVLQRSGWAACWCVPNLVPEPLAGSGLR